MNLPKIMLEISKTKSANLGFLIFFKINSNTTFSSSFFYKKSINILVKLFNNYLT